MVDLSINTHVHRWVCVLLCLGSLWTIGTSPSPTTPPPNGSGGPTWGSKGEITDLQLPPQVENYGDAFFKMMVTLVIFLILVILTIWFLKRLAQGKIGKAAHRHAQIIQIIERRAISPKSVLYIVEIEGTRLLLAESQHEVRALHPWAAPKKNEPN